MNEEIRFQNFLPTPSDKLKNVIARAYLVQVDKAYHEIRLPTQ